MTVIKPLAKEANHNHQRNINVKTGLTEEQVLEQRKQYGTNEFSKPSERGLLKEFLDIFKEPLMVILFIASGMSFLVG